MFICSTVACVKLNQLVPDLCVLVVVRRLRSNEARSEWKSVA